MEGVAFLRGVVQTFPVLTDNGVAFTKNASTKWDTMQHPFDCVCDEQGIEHRLTKPSHPWTNDQAERMNRTVKDATTKAFHYETADAFRVHVQAFLASYNFAKHLKALRWCIPFQVICDAWKASPSVFKINPNHLTPGPNTWQAGQRRARHGRHRCVTTHSEGVAFRCLPRLKKQIF